jgi:hypothetical protein
MLTSTNNGDRAVIIAALPFKAKILLGISLVASASAVAVETVGASHILGQTLSFTSIIAAVAVFVVTKTKTERNERDISSLKGDHRRGMEEVSQTMQSLRNWCEREFSESRGRLDGLRDDMREDFREHRKEMGDMMRSVKKTVEQRAVQVRKEDRPPQSGE